MQSVSIALLDGVSVVRIRFGRRDTTSMPRLYRETFRDLGLSKVSILCRQDGHLT